MIDHPSFRYRLRGLLTACGLAAGLAACAQAPVPTDTFYRLDTAEVAAPAPAPAPASVRAPVLAGAVEIRPLTTDGVLRQRAIAFIGPDGQGLEHYSYHFWAESPADAVQRVLAEAVRAAGIFDTVVTPEIRVATDYEVQGRLSRFEQVLGGAGPRFVAELDLTVLRKRGLGLMLMKTYRAERPAAAPSVEAAVAAARLCLADIFKEFAEDLRMLR
jgi:ABC-type uncharacterized transport system auxiliary subunit